MRKVSTFGGIVVLFFASRGAAARETPSVDELDDGERLDDDALGMRGLLRTRAESVSFDARARSLELSGDVRLDVPPFHLRSDHIKLARTRWGIEADGKGSLAFCPCLGTPVTIEFDKAIVAPPGELLLRNPKLEIYGVPVMYLPWFWLRSDEKVGVLPPDIAYRGQDGVFLGEGVHLPWKSDGTRSSLDVRAGAYVDGGFSTDVRLRSSVTTTKIRYDRLPGARAPVLPASHVDANADDGLFVDSRGASRSDGATVAWDADILRGRRGVASTSDLDAAAKPWDRAGASAAVVAGPIVAETGVRATTRRGGDLSSVEAIGPFAALRSSGALASSVTYDATVEGGSLRVSASPANIDAGSASVTPDAVSYARAELGLLAATSFGPVVFSALGRASGDVAAEGRRGGKDRAGTARLHLAAPMARAFEARDGSPDARVDPIVHVIEPFLDASILHGAGDTILGSLPGRGMASARGTVPITDMGLTSTIGRWGRREALEISAAGGAVYGDSETTSAARPIARGHLSSSFENVGIQVETALVGSDARARGGFATVGRARIGSSDGVRLFANVAVRDGVDPVLSRALTDPTLESPAGWLAREGATGGAGLVVPWGSAITTSVGGDADATNAELVALRGGLELRDRCHCVTLRANGSHRIGRQGVDVWIAIDFAADR